MVEPRGCLNYWYCGYGFARHQRRSVAGRAELGEGTIGFFIPLKAASAGTFGVGGVGLSADTCTYDTHCADSTMDMFLRFNPVRVGPNILTLEFNDLDIYRVNDPWFFLESVSINMTDRRQSISIISRTRAS